MKTSPSVIIPPVPPHWGWPCRWGMPGLTDRQANMAFKAIFKEEEPRDALDRYCVATQRVIDARRELAAAMSEQRRILIEAMLRHYPAAARRILAGIRRAWP
jgi:hypothetical protein